MNAAHRWIREHKISALALTAVCAALATLLVLNFAVPEKRIQQVIVHRYSATDAQFRHELGTLLGPPILEGNAVADLENGDRIFPAMLEAVRGAKRSITFETYIYWSGEIGRTFASALSERSRSGVKVHVLIDWLGSQKMEEGLAEQMRDAGVEIEKYHPLRWYHLSRLNNRTHRKILITDGRIAFTGGVGIADVWTGDAQDPEHWRDSHYRVEGPVVAQMQAAFMDNWIKTTGRVLQGQQYFPALGPAGTVAAQVFTSSPRGGADSMSLMYLMAIASSEHSIDLSAAYFVPDELTLRVLLDALRRGVKVRIITPGEHIDSQVVRKASKESWDALLAAGAEIHEYQPTMFHCKMLIADRFLVSVGSTNFDSRSFRLNDEANLNLYDGGFAHQVTRVFEQDLLRTRRITLDQWRARPWYDKALEAAASVFASQL
ncbi:MAG: phospholipase D-like domain-containing protein [Gammaproteobacteria bacterium]